MEDDLPARVEVLEVRLLALEIATRQLMRYAPPECAHALRALQKDRNGFMLLSGLSDRQLDSLPQVLEGLLRADDAPPGTDRP